MTTKTIDIMVNVMGNAAQGLNVVRTNIDAATRAMSNFNKATQLFAFNERLNKVGMQMSAVGRITEIGTGKFVKMEQAVKLVSASMGGLNKRAATFDMRLLSLLFGGMALKRAFGGMLRSIFDTFKKAEDNTSGLNQATVRLNASWEFLKFSIMDALNNDTFIGWIDNLIEIINKMSQWSSASKIAVLSVITGLFLVGSTMMLIGQTKLGWDAIMGVGGFLNTPKGIGTATAGIHAKTLGKTGVFSAIKNFLAAGFVIKTIFDIGDFLDGEATLLDTIDEIGTNLALIGVLTGNVWLITIGVAMKLLPASDKLKEVGANMMKSGKARLEKGAFRTPTTQFPDPGQLAGGIETVTGSILSGWGIMGGWINDYIEGIDSSAKIMTNDMAPATEGVTDALIGTKEKKGLAGGFEDVGKEMEEVATNKTNKLIESNNKINESTKEMTRIQQEYNNTLAKSRSEWESLSERVESFAGNSSVTGDG